MLEEQLTSLGERWASVCQWTEQQWSVLQDVQLQWQRYADAQRQFEDWLSKAESSLAIMRLTQPHSDTDAIEMLKKIKVCVFSAIYWKWYPDLKITNVFEASEPFIRLTYM